MSVACIQPHVNLSLGTRGNIIAVMPWLRCPHELINTDVGVLVGREIL